jgi:hypothetical protein
VFIDLRACSFGTHVCFARQLTCSTSADEKVSAVSVLCSTRLDNRDDHCLDQRLPRGSAHCSPRVDALQLRDAPVWCVRSVGALRSIHKNDPLVLGHGDVLFGGQEWRRERCLAWLPASCWNPGVLCSGSLRRAPALSSPLLSCSFGLAQLLIDGAGLFSAAPRVRSELRWIRCWPLSSPKGKSQPH